MQAAEEKDTKCNRRTATKSMKKKRKKIEIKRQHVRCAYLYVSALCVSFTNKSEYCVKLIICNKTSLITMLIEYTLQVKRDE